MQDLADRTAVVTGGGSGIGRGLVLALAESGANVVVADIEEQAAETVAKEAEAEGVKAIAVRADVADFASMEALAEASWSAFGDVHVLCNNAGVFIMGPLADMNVDDWAWLTSVNVMGVVHGIHAFVPRMREAGVPAHVVNTSSVAGLGGGGGGGGIYGMTKCAVMSISESLHAELSAEGIGVSVLCPANIASQILGAQRNRPESFGRLADEPFGRISDFGLDPMLVGRKTRDDGILGGDLYVFTFPVGWENHLKPGAQARYEALMAAIDKGGIPE